MQKVIKLWLIFMEWICYSLFNYFYRKVLCISCWNGSKICVVGVAECKKFLNENLDEGPKADEPSVEQSSAPVISLAADARQISKEEVLAPAAAQRQW